MVTEDNTNWANYEKLSDGQQADKTAFVQGMKSQVCVFSNLYSNFWLIFGKLLEARSRLYRSRILQVNTRLKALGEIYKIYTLLQLGILI